MSCEEKGSAMTDLTALREAAEETLAARALGKGWTHGAIIRLREMQDLLDPAVVLALVDEVGRLRDEEAEFRAELERRAYLASAVEMARMSIHSLTDVTGSMLKISEMQAERDRLRAAIQTGLALHRPVHAVFSWRGGLRYKEPCGHCHGRAGIHECRCWADEDIEIVCRECDQPTGSAIRHGARTFTPYPCATARALSTALGEEQS